MNTAFCRFTVKCRSGLLNKLTCSVSVKHNLVLSLNGFASFSSHSECNTSQLETSTPIPEITKAFQLKGHDEIYRFSIENPDLFWGEIAKERLLWQKPFSIVSEHNYENKIFKWFPDGCLNVSENCVDRHAEKTPDKVALIWEKDEPGREVQITYGELKNMVCRLANVLLDSNVKKGDRVAIYLPVSPIAVAAMLACSRIGAVHSVIFAGFSPEAISNRILDAQAETVITIDKCVRGGKTIDLRKAIKEALKLCNCVKRTFITSYDQYPLQLSQHEIDLDEAMGLASSKCDAVIQGAEDPLFLLYTSGSTGKPKGLCHTTAGYLLYSAFTHEQVFDYKENDIFGCVADIGWITGHSYVVYGPLANGATTVLFESTPTYPDPGRYWDTVSRLGITHFYCAPTALRLLLSYGDSWVNKYDTSSLRFLGSVGEPLNHEAWHWFNDVVGKNNCTLVDTWWQSETGGIMISPRPSAKGAPVLPGMPMRPSFGIHPVLLDTKGKEMCGHKVTGAICIKSLWPGIARTIHGDHKRYVETYFNTFPGYFFCGDGAYRNENNHYQIIGRVDDVINVSGHRIGTAELEDIMDDHEDVAESAVVGYPHDLKGESIYAFITLKEQQNKSEKEIISDLKHLSRSKIAAYAVPDKILIVSDLPKTRSGKIMRRILRKIAEGKHNDLGDISTLADPSVVKYIVELHLKDEKSC